MDELVLLGGIKGIKEEKKKEGKEGATFASVVGSAFLPTITCPKISPSSNQYVKHIQVSLVACCVSNESTLD